MSYVFLAIAVILAAYFASKFFKQKYAIRLLAESLETRTSILTHSREFRETSESWSKLVDELNHLLEEIGRLDKQSSGRLRQIETTLGSLQEGVLIIDRDNYILLANKKLQLTFSDLRDCEGKRLESAFHSSEFLEFIHEVKRDGVGRSKELVFREAQKEIWMEVSVSMLEVAEEGSAPWFLFVLHDITRLKELESVRQQFVANASHELKTPVSVIKGYAETLLSDHGEMEESDRGRFLETIHRHSERLALLINDLLSLSRLESDARTLDWAHRDIFEWLRELRVEYRQNLESEGREFAFELPENLEADVRCDTLRMRQVLDNLVENACKYTPAGGAISLGGAVVDGNAQIWIADEGPGVPERDVAKIFERFYRVDKGRSRDTGGTGLGLSIVKHIVDSHGGRIWSENVEGKGLKVVLRLPMAKKEASAPLV